MSLHAFDSDIFVGLGGLGLKHLGKSSLSLLADQSVLCHRNNFLLKTYYACDCA
jgi:hypothetical protein